MPLSLHNIKPAKGSTKKKKRVGRGNSSGHGTYSTRGIKGQRSRSGGKSGLKRLGFKQALKGIPKKKGFKSDKPSNQAVNLISLNECFSDGAKINASSLFKAGLIGSIRKPVKILGGGELKIKRVEVKGIKISETAKAQIEKNEGKIL